MNKYIVNNKIANRIIEVDSPPFYTDKDFPAPTLTAEERLDVLEQEVDGIAIILEEIV